MIFVLHGLRMDVDKCKCDILYGQLIVLGFNGRIPFETGDQRLASKFLLKQREFGNAETPVKQQCYESAKNSCSTSVYSVAYVIGEKRTCVVKYKTLADVDMFQIGRSSHVNDYVMMDIVPNAKTASDCILTRSTISRFACRIYVDRCPPYTARIYASGFDKSKNIALGSKAIKCIQDDGMMDGLTTNGVLILHPNNNSDTSTGPGIWREVSVAGNMYSLRKARSDRNAGKRIAGESNVLVDGTLIDLCGTTLLWKSKEGMERMPTMCDIDDARHKLNATRPQCPIGLMTLQFPSNPYRSSHHDHSKTPYVYLKCGHVHGYHTWNNAQKVEEEQRICPVCRQVGPYTKLQLGYEAALWVDCKPDYFAFVPCGHVCSQATARFWSQVPLPHGCHAFRAACPFCGTPLQNSNGYVKLIFS
ncbi:E3 ubiquitin-protein ligase pellino homolog 1-like isoform X2 [Xenia sp. Carnegie-2017]|uniref:E3 ubiquitin-protein ligase pellino homolog 1-like isoform X2 n=1 Tax=Xenia sp. Carnegie-2017 TaxID=2897299 RepID=UPI001F04142B|nr:E3 ubiquitin-protein ligase pellino homolog 1-like isoform X2 [Xenia sp. Carnegie-2017]